MKRLIIYEYELEILEGKIPSKELCEKVVNGSYRDNYLYFLLECLPFEYFREDAKKTFEKLKHIATTYVSYFNVALDDSLIDLYVLYITVCKCAGYLDDDMIQLCQKAVALTVTSDFGIVAKYQIIHRLLGIFTTQTLDTSQMRYYLSCAKELEHDYNEAHARIEVATIKFFNN